MIGYDRLGSNGQLGNQMFQYAALRGIASFHGYEWCIPPANYNHLANYDIHSFELKNLKKEGFINSIINEQSSHSFEGLCSLNPNIKTIRENGFAFDKDLFENFEDGSNLDGFCQTEKYFKHISNEIREDFTFNKDNLEPCQEFISSLDSPPIFLHVRRGDAVGKEDYHPIAPMSYYIEALKRFDDDTPCFVFTDDLDWCKSQEYFQSDRFLFNENVERYEYQSRDGLGRIQNTLLPHVDMCLMSLCSGGIIVNSSFSWWGAWLQNDRGKIIAPSPWFGPSASDLDTSDIIPDRWEIIDWSLLE